MPSKANSKKSKRRQFLRTIGTIGASSIAFSGAATADDTVKIPVAFTSPDNPILFEEVPTEWLNQIDRAEQVTHELQAQHEETPGVVRIGATTTGATVGGIKTLEVVVEADLSVLSNKIIPSQINGVNVRTVEAEPISATCLNKRQFDRIPGGVVNNNRETGTSFCRAKKGGEYYMLTAGHLYYKRGNCGAQLKGRHTFQTGRMVGRVRRAFKRHDWVGYRRDNLNVRFTNQIKKKSGRVGIDGYMGKYGTAHWAGRGEYFVKVGISTGETVNNNGVVTMYSDASYHGGCVHMDGHGVVVPNNQALGDSGGPIFVKKNGRWLVVAIATFRQGRRIGTACNQPLYPRGGGWPAYKLANQANFRFGV